MTKNRKNAKEPRLRLTVTLEYDIEPANYGSAALTPLQCAAQDRETFENDFNVLFEVLSSGTHAPTITVEPV